MIPCLRLFFALGTGHVIAKDPTKLLLKRKHISDEATYITILYFTKTFEVKRHVIDKEPAVLDSDGPDTHRENVHIMYVLIRH